MMLAANTSSVRGNTTLQLRACFAASSNFKPAGNLSWEGGYIVFSMLRRDHSRNHQINTVASGPLLEFRYTFSLQTLFSTSLSASRSCIIKMAFCVLESCRLGSETCIFLRITFLCWYVLHILTIGRWRCVSWRRRSKKCNWTFSEVNNLLVEPDTLLHSD